MVQILSEFGQPVARVCVDQGGEFLNPIFNGEMKRRGIDVHYTSNKCYLVERAIQSLKNYITKFLDNQQNKNYVHHLQHIFYTLNNRPHRFLNNLTPENASRPEYRHRVLNIIVNKSRRKRKSPNFKVGQKVRLWKWQNKFSRSFQQKFTDEIFIIAEVKTTLPIPSYRLKDLEGDDIIGTVYEHELQPVIK